VVESSQPARNNGGPRAAFVQPRFCPHCPPKLRSVRRAHHVSLCTCRNCPDFAGKFEPVAACHHRRSFARRMRAIAGRAPESRSCSDIKANRDRASAQGGGAASTSDLQAAFA
jgi:hypothetical protein